MERLDIRLLGSFEVSVDGRPLPDGVFAQRRAADLVKVLALASGHRAPRDRVVELLWPQLGADAGVANLHKAAHYARRALGGPDGVVLRQGLVELAPAAAVRTDVERFEAGDEAAYAGELLPDDRYEEWATAARERLRARRLAILRRAERWDELLAEEPADEQAHLALMRADLAAGDRLAAVRRFRALRDELARLGLQPPAEAQELMRELSGGAAVRAGRMLDTPIAGRDRELAQAVLALRRAADGRGVTLLVVGDAGMGKTRYVEAALSGAERRGWHTLRGRARAGGAGIPYHPAIEALEPLLAERPDLAARLSDGSRAALAALSPAAPGEGAPRHRLLWAVAQLLHEAAADRGVLLALEDLHAADDATLQLVEFLAGGVRGEPLVLVATMRPDGPAARLRAALRDQRSATEVQLEPLAEDALQAIAERAAGRSLPGEVARAAGGNPFYAEELGRSADATGRLRIPDHLHELLDARLAGLPEPLLGVLAALEDGFSADELAAVAHVEPERAQDELARAVDVLEEDAAGWRFRHPLLREAARRRAAPAALARAHADAAGVLTAPERVAHHLLAAGRGPDAVPHLRAAALHARAVGAYGDGRRWVEQAIPHAPEPELGALFALLGELRFATGDRASLGAFAQAVRRAGEDAPPDLLVKQAIAAMALGDLDTAAHALAGMPAGTPEQRANGCVALAMLAWYRNDMDAAARLVEQAAALEQAAGVEIPMLLDVRATVAHANGRWEAHAAWELDAAWLAPDLAGRVFDVYLCVTECVMLSGMRLAGFAGELGRRARDVGARRGEAFAATVLGESCLLEGDAEAARGHLEAAARISREVGAAGGEALARARLGEALDALGDRAGARASVEDALELAHASTLAHHLLYIVHVPLLRVQEDADAALAVLDRAEVLLCDQGGCGFCPIGFSLAAASVCAAAGDVPRADGYLERAEQLAGRWHPAGMWSAALCEARGDVLRARGDGEAAEVALRRALEGYATVGRRLDHARVERALT